MPFPSAKTFVVILPNYYGKGSTLEEAMKNARKAGYNNRKKVDTIVVATDAAYDDVEVRGGVGVEVKAPPAAVILTLTMRL